MEKFGGSHTGKGFIGGTVGSVRRAYRTLRIIRVLLQLASNKQYAGALLHNSVILNSFMESNQVAIDKLINGVENQYTLVNAKSTPWPNMDHTKTIAAYVKWQDDRAMEATLATASRMLYDKHQRFIKGTKSKKRADLPAALAKNIEMDSRELRRATLRSLIMSSMRVQLSDKAECRRCFAPECSRLALGIIVYRQMPKEVQEQVDSSAFTVEQIATSALRSRTKYHEYYSTTKRTNFVWKMRTLPSHYFTALFDQRTYLENTVVPRVEHVLKQTQMTPDEAVDYVFPVKQGKENNCQRAFGNWVLLMLRNMISPKFSSAYKQVAAKIVSGKMEMSSLCSGTTASVFGELLVKIDKLIEEFEATIKVIDSRSSNSTVDRKSKAAAAAKGAAAAKAAPSEEDSEETAAAAVKSQDLILPLPIDDLLPKERQVSRLESAANYDEKKRKLEESDPYVSDLPFPNPSTWRVSTQVLDEQCAKPFVSKAQVPASVAIVEQLGLVGDMRREMSLRTPLEVAVGSRIITSATNAAAAGEGSSSRKKTTDDDEGAPQARDAGVDSRRMVNELTFKHIPEQSFIQHTDKAGTVPEAQPSDPAYKKRRLLLGMKTVDEDSMPQSAEEIRSMSLDTKDDALRRLRFLYGVEKSEMRDTKRMCDAVHKTHTPGRTDTETNSSVLSSQRMKDVLEDTAKTQLAFFERMANWGKMTE